MWAAHLGHVMTACSNDLYLPNVLAGLQPETCTALAQQAVCLKQCIQSYHAIQQPEFSRQCGLVYSGCMGLKQSPHNSMLVQVSIQVPELCVLFHESVQALSQRFLAKERRHVYITPTSYLELIHSYKTLLSKKQNEASQPAGMVPVPLAC